MKKLFAFLLSLSLVGTTNSFCQDNRKFVGSWEGKLNVGIELTIVIHIKNENDTVSSILDSPDQNAFGIPANKTTIREGELYVEIKSLAATFKGKLENDSVITGTFTQNATFPLVLRKTNKPTGPPKRPQTPKPPFPYKSEDVEYDNADKTVHFGATLTYPLGKGPFVTAILITGSGQQDRDETILGHKPFAIIADYLTRNGFAVLRIDDRGTGRTSGEVMTASSEDFAKDIMTAMDYLRTKKEVIGKKIGLIGHSDGGLIASIVLTQRKDVAFVISLAGPGMKGADILSYQGELIMRKAGIDSITASAYSKLYKRIINYSLTEKDSAVCLGKVWSDYTEWKKTMHSNQLKQLGFADDPTTKKVFRNLLHELYLPWMQFFNKSDASVNYQKAYCPVLALNGAEDIQVIADKNLEGIRSGLEKSRIKKYEIRKLPGLNHLFQHCQKCSLAEYGQLEESFAPEALQIMSDWLKENTQ